MASTNFTTRLTRAPKPRTPRFGRILFTVTIIGCALAALGYRYSRDTHDRAPLAEFAQSLFLEISGDGAGSTIDPTTRDAAREALDDAGADVARLELRAIGGCRARIATAGQEATVGTIANLYLAGENGMFALEITVGSDSGIYSLARVWKATRVHTLPREHAREAADRFLTDTETDLGSAQITSPEFFFYELR